MAVLLLFPEMSGFLRTHFLFSRFPAIYDSVLLTVYRPVSEILIFLEAAMILLYI